MLPIERGPLSATAPRARAGSQSALRPGAAGDGANYGIGGGGGGGAAGHVRVRARQIDYAGAVTLQGGQGGPSTCNGDVQSPVGAGGGGGLLRIEYAKALALPTFDGTA